MKATPFVFAGAAVIWIAGSLWWIAQRKVCGCGLRRAVVAQQYSPAVISLGPAPALAAAEPPAPAPSSSAAAPAERPAAGAPADVAVPPLLFIVPFTKNQGGLSATAGWDDYTAVLSQYFLGHPDASLIVTGHTDGDGDPGANRDLSLARAERVKDALVSAGIAAERIRAHGAGADHPVSDNLTSAGKARNRRVEIELEP